MDNFNVVITKGNSVSGGAQAEEFEMEDNPLKLNWYPQCCTAKVINSFGAKGSANAFAGGGRHSHYQTDSLVEAIKKWVKWASFKKEAILTAVTTSEQLEANEALEVCGFIKSEPIKNIRYPTTYLYNWYLPIHGNVDPEVTDKDGVY